MTAQVVYPKEGECPFCKNILKFNNEERSQKSLVECPSCEAQYPIKKVFENKKKLEILTTLKQEQRKKDYQEELY